MSYLPTLPETDILSYVFVLEAPFTSTTFSETITLFGLPQNYAICGIKLNPTIAFVGTGFFTITCSVGVSGSNTFYAPAFNVMQSAQFQLSTPLAQYSTAAHSINAYVTSTGAPINSITAGELVIVIQIRSFA